MNKRMISIVFAVACLMFLALIWSDSPHRELVWFILPIGGLFRQIGGTWGSAVGRFLTPILPVFAVAFFIGWSWGLLAVYGCYLLMKTAPVTMGGSSITKNWISWTWPWILGYLNGLISLSVSLPIYMGWVSVWTAIVPLFVYGICITLSNLSFSRKWVVWKFCEFMMGASALYPVAQIIEQYR